VSKETIAIPNISCGHCVMSIKNELGDMPGVTRVDGSADEKSITVEWDAPATLEGIKAKLKEIHYPAAE
jgi:copper chaperone CopZ